MINTNINTKIKKFFNIGRESGFDQKSIDLESLKEQAFKNWQKYDYNSVRILVDQLREQGDITWQQYKNTGDSEMDNLQRGSYFWYDKNGKQLTTQDIKNLSNQESVVENKIELKSDTTPSFAGNTNFDLEPLVKPKPIIPLPTIIPKSVLEQQQERINPIELELETTINESKNPFAKRYINKLRKDLFDSRISVKQLKDDILIHLARVAGYDLSLESLQKLKQKFPEVSKNWYRYGSVESVLKRQELANNNLKQEKKQKLRNSGFLGKLKSIRVNNSKIDGYIQLQKPSYNKETGDITLRPTNIITGYGAMALSSIVNIPAQINKLILAPELIYNSVFAKQSKPKLQLPIIPKIEVEKPLARDAQSALFAINNLATKSAINLAKLVVFFNISVGVINNFEPVFKTVSEKAELIDNLSKIPMSRDNREVIQNTQNTRISQAVQKSANNVWEDITDDTGKFFTMANLGNFGKNVISNTNPIQAWKNIKNGFRSNKRIEQDRVFGEANDRLLAGEKVNSNNSNEVNLEIQRMETQQKKDIEKNERSDKTNLKKQRIDQVNALRLDQGLPPVQGDIELRRFQEREKNMSDWTNKVISQAEYINDELQKQGKDKAFDISTMTNQSELEQYNLAVKWGEHMRRYQSILMSQPIQQSKFAQELSEATDKAVQMRIELQQRIDNRSRSN